MFRIDRTFVNLSTTRYVMIRNESAAAGDKNAAEAGSEDEMSDLGQTLSESVQAGGDAGSPPGGTRGEDGTSASGGSPASGSGAAGARGESAQAKAQAEARQIIEDAEEEAQAAAEKIVGDARDEAAAILLEAREQAKEEQRAAVEEGFAAGNADGHAKGYEDGVAKGYEEGRKDFDAKIEEDDTQLLGIISDIYRQIELSEAELENGVTQLSLDIVRKVIDPSDAGSGVFESLIRNALRQIRTDRKIVIHVGQAEFKRFFPSGSASFQLDGGVTVKAAVVEDQTLGEGDVVIDAEEETINAGLETQLQAIELAFSRADV